MNLPAKSIRLIAVAVIFFLHAPFAPAEGLPAWVSAERPEEFVIGFYGWYYARLRELNGNPPLASDRPDIARVIRACVDPRMIADYRHAVKREDFDGPHPFVPGNEYDPWWGDRVKIVSLCTLEDRTIVRLLLKGTGRGGAAFDSADTVVLVRKDTRWLIVPGSQGDQGSEGCWYAPKDTNGISQPGIVFHDHCASIRNGKISLCKGHLDHLGFDRYGIASVMIGSRPYYVKPDGSMLPVVAFDNWADEYIEGLTRSEVEGKIAYYDRNFNQQIPPIYDWGWPFENGRALVCKGCRRQPGDTEGHRSVLGGRWGYIDQAGNEVVPVEFSREEARRRLTALTQAAGPSIPKRNRP